MPRPRKPGKDPVQTPQLNTRLAAEDLVKLEAVLSFSVVDVTRFQ